MAERKRVLFFAEAVTLAHVARPLALGAALDPAKFEVVLACNPHYSRFFGHLAWPIRSLNSISSERFMNALQRGAPVYDASTLRSYVREDLKLIEELMPDIVVGDFRLSLSISARLSKIPYVTITSAYWSPYSRPYYRVPDLPLTRLAGTVVGQILFNAVRPLAFAFHTRPLNAVRREYGLPSLGLDVRTTYTDADYTLYADIPEMVATHGLPSSHRYIGPVLWSPPGTVPSWWDKLPRDRPLIYVTLGSSGQGRLLPAVVEALAGIPVTAMVAAAGQALPGMLPANVYIADYLPGSEAAARARAVICNGGSPTSHQALAAGVPVLGLASNLDQFLNMEAVVAAGAGVVTRAAEFRFDAFRANVNRLLSNESYAEAAKKVKAWFIQYQSGKRFAELMTDVAGC